jgi:phosphoribosylformylglycinamidine cyclo-ligase
VEREEMEKAFNMGVGMVAVVAPEDVDRALAVLTARHVPSWVLGEVTKAEVGGAALVGDHPRF